MGVYRLTDAGRKELDRFDGEVRHIWRRAGRWNDWSAMFDPDAAEIRSKSAVANGALRCTHLTITAIATCS